MNEIVRIQPFDVLWTSATDDEGNFLDLRLANLLPVEQTTEAAWLNKYKYGFPQETTFPSPLNDLGES
jgi:hypothetical protein